jgi:long-subunit fatty acid transport protein
MTKKWLVAVVGAAAMTLSAGALAQGTVPNFYIGAELGQTSVDTADEDFGFKFLAGYQFHRNIAAEFAYGMLYDKGGVDLTSLEITALGLFPINPQFSIYGKLGFARLESDGGGDDNDITFGLGVQWDANRNLGVRAGWQRYNVDPSVDWLHVGVTWRF